MPFISQDPTYHNFADQSRIFGIPHFYDVVTNFPFVIIGIWGLMVVKRADSRWFFIGFLLTGFGSAYYHLNPNNDTLVWDRLPMSISLMASLCQVCSDYHVKSVKLYPSLCFGIASVIYWAKYDELGPYGLVQFGSLLWIIALVLGYRSPYSTKKYLLAAYFCYFVAKICESSDWKIYTLTRHIVSGHSLKHLAAALGGVFYILHHKNPGRKFDNKSN